MSTNTQRAVTMAECLTWHGTHQLNSGGLLEPAAEERYTELDLCATTLGPTQDGREGGPH
jgi:hypothetical protein